MMTKQNNLLKSPRNPQDLNLSQNIRKSQQTMEKLEAELSGITEKGYRPPLVRIPIKTHLSSVLLMNNPWEERDLKRKLEYIKKERARREKALNWGQRHFFVKQIFDPDYNLRFTKEKKNLQGKMEEKNRKLRKGKTNTTDECHEDLESDEESKLPDINLSGHGIFKKPLRSNLMKVPSGSRISLISKGNSKQSSSLQSLVTPRRTSYHHQKADILRVHQDTQNTSSSGSTKTLENSQDGSDGTDTDSCSSSPSKENIIQDSDTSIFHNSNELSNQQVSPQNDYTSSDDPKVARRSLRLRRSYTTILEVVHEVPSSAETTESALKLELSFQKSLSLPHINLHKKKSPRPESQSQRIIETASSVSESSSSNNLPGLVDSPRVSEIPSEICDEAVISRITNRLPISLMLRANQNLNKSIMHQKTKLLEKCRIKSERNMLEDPRYEALRSVLVAVDSLDDYD